MKLCNKCGETKPLDGFHKDKTHRDGLRSVCIECDLKLRKVYYQKNAQKIRERVHQYAIDNPEKKKEGDRKRYLKNATSIKEKTKQWVMANWAKHLEHGRKWRKNNPEKVSEQKRKWFAKNPEKSQEWKHSRRAREMGGSSVVTAREWKLLKEVYKFTCLCCGQREPEIKLTRDHVVPLAKGGVNEISNIQPLCIRCNKKKHIKTIDYRNEPDKHLGMLIEAMTEVTA